MLLHGPCIFGLKNALVLWMAKPHAEANFARASGQLRAKPPVFCKHPARTIILNKKMRTPFKNLRIYATQVLNKCYLSTLRMTFKWTAAQDYDRFIFLHNQLFKLIYLGKNSRVFAAIWYGAL